MRYVRKCLGKSPQASFQNPDVMLSLREFVSDRLRGEERRLKTMDNDAESV